MNNETTAQGWFEADVGGHVKLDVELYGRVIVATRGYRAEYQRVLKVTLPTQCIWDDVVDPRLIECGKMLAEMDVLPRLEFLRSLDPDELALIEKGLKVVYYRHARCLETACRVAVPVDGDIRQVCGGHAIDAAAEGLLILTVGDIANQLGTEVVWGD